VDVLRRGGIEAQVEMSHPLVGGGIGFWPVMVREADAERAREALGTNEEVDIGEMAIAECPGCRYDLQGLGNAARCPECGMDLDELRSRLGGVLVAEAADPPTQAESIDWPWRRLAVVTFLAATVLAIVWLTPEYYLTDPVVALVGVTILIVTCWTVWRIVRFFGLGTSGEGGSPDQAFGTAAMSKSVRVDPVEVADAASEFEAELLAGTLRAEGIGAGVIGPDRLLTAGLGRWTVHVGRSAAEQASAVLLRMRRENVSEEGLEECPECGYALDGLGGAEACPECGQRLGWARAARVVRGIRAGDPPGPVGHERARPWLWAAMVVSAATAVLGWKLRAEWGVGAPWPVAPGAAAVSAVLLVWIFVVSKRRSGRGTDGGEHAWTAISGRVPASRSRAHRPGD
jgi:ssDNA-binding Zn-finger/Zn-ribbon topoisomerase 1